MQLQAPRHDTGRPAAALATGFPQRGHQQHPASHSSHPELVQIAEPAVKVTNCTQRIASSCPGLMLNDASSTVLAHPDSGCFSSDKLPTRLLYQLRWWRIQVLDAPMFLFLKILHACDLVACLGCSESWRISARGFGQML
ncbi:hypothetical protein PAHAL_2G392300 [Panicum hallii]|jgi:hypothetical protein|uniref:Uncharacterized protein n=1 Tax=Panicum hallii TaxID=206008 RepID=A0A2S3H1F0_9POAL|nr:hypothetical protein PAHAL_2G392300 [Panicum hallii]